jgi:hypothetical protein
MADYSIYLFHILFVGPLLAFIGLYHNSPSFPKIIWDLLVVMGFGIILYHSWMAYRLYNILNTSK